jgi:hypothetical protein
MAMSLDGWFRPGFDKDVDNNKDIDNNKDVNNNNDIDNNRGIDNNKDIENNRDIDNNKDVKWNNMCGFKRPKIYLLWTTKLLPIINVHITE